MLDIAVGKIVKNAFACARISMQSPYKMTIAWMVKKFHTVYRTQKLH